MPLYDFCCVKCKREYDEIAPFDETGKYPSVVCPHCGSKKKKRLIGAPSFKFANPIGTDRWVSDDTGHDYRHNWNMENRVKPQRELAEKASHMGASPYNSIDDISSGKYFGEIK